MSNSQSFICIGKNRTDTKEFNGGINISNRIPLVSPLPLQLWLKTDLPTSEVPYTICHCNHCNIEWIDGHHISCPKCRGMANSETDYVWDNIKGEYHSIIYNGNTVTGIDILIKI